MDTIKEPQNFSVTDIHGSLPNYCFMKTFILLAWDFYWQWNWWSGDNAGIVDNENKVIDFDIDKKMEKIALNNKRYYYVFSVISHRSPVI